MGVGTALLALLLVVMTALSGCSYGYREDVDQIGSIRTTRTLGFKEGPREEAYRPYRNQTNNYYPQEEECEKPERSTQASPYPPENFDRWAK